MREMEGIMNGGSDKGGSWGMGGYPMPRAGAGGPMGMKNGPPPFGNGAANFAAPPGPQGYRPSYPPPASGNFGGPQYGGGPGWLTSGCCYCGTMLPLEYIFSDLHYSSYLGLEVDVGRVPRACGAYF